MQTHDFDGQSNGSCSGFFVNFRLLYFFIICILLADCLYLFSDLTTVRVIIGLIGKLGITVAFDIVYLWSSEIYPTVTRYDDYNYHIHLILPYESEEKKVRHLK